MVTFAIVAICLTIGLISIAYGQTNQTITTPHFKFNYPDGWMVMKEGNRFNGYDTAVSPISESSAVDIGISEVPNVGILTDAQIIERLKHAMTTTPVAEDATLFESGINKYVVNNQTAPYSIHTISCGTYSSFDCKPRVHMAVIVKIGSQNYVMFQYTANEDVFDKYLSQVEAILRSVAPIK